MTEEEFERLLSLRDKLINDSARPLDEREVAYPFVPYVGEDFDRSRFPTLLFVGQATAGNYGHDEDSHDYETLRSLTRHYILEAPGRSRFRREMMRVANHL